MLFSIKEATVHQGGRTEFFHPPGTRDDLLWAFALAVCTPPERRFPDGNPSRWVGHIIRDFWTGVKKRLEVKYATPGEATVTYHGKCPVCWSDKGPDGKCSKGHRDAAGNLRP